MIADKQTRKIICIHNDIGKRHDFKLYKTSRVFVHCDIMIQADTGYQGLQKRHKNSELPKKRSKKKTLTSQDKKRNREISSGRVLIENIIRELKIFRIVSEKYRNRRRRFNLRMNIIAGIYNLQIK